MTRSTLVVMAAAAALAGCESMAVDNPFNPAPTFVSLNESSAAPLTLSRGQSIVVTLPANLATSDRWEAMPGFSPTLALTGTPDYVMPAGVGGATASAGPSQPVATVPFSQVSWSFKSLAVGTTAQTIRPTVTPIPVGEGGQMTFVFLAATAGTTSLELAYRRPFEPNVAPSKTVRYDITVR